MFLALLRFILFFLPLAFLNGVSFIVFDDVEIVSVDFDLKKRKKKNKKDLRREAINSYLKDCYKQKGSD